MADKFLPLPELAELIRNEPRFRYDSACAAGYGRAHLRVWRCADDDPVQYLAVLTQIDDGASITNSAADIWHALANQYGQQVVVLEHWPDDGDCTPEHVDQVTLDRGKPTWRRVWPSSEDHPDHVEFTAWAQKILPVLQAGT